MRPAAVALLFAFLAAYVLMSVEKHVPWWVHGLVGLCWLISVGIVHEMGMKGQDRKDG